MCDEYATVGESMGDYIYQWVSNKDFKYVKSRRNTKYSTIFWVFFAYLLCTMSFMINYVVYL